MKTEELKKKIIVAIQDEGKKRGRAPRQKEIGYTYKEIQDCFGSLKQAVREALEGQDISSGREKEKQRMLEHVKAVAEELGRVPSQKEIGFTYYEINRYFDSIKQMIALSGIDEKTRKQKKKIARKSKTKEEVIQMVHEEVRKLGEVPLYRNLRCRNLVDKHFGSWNEMLEEAGLPKKQRNVRLEKEKILKELHKKTKELGRTPRIAEVEGASSLKFYYKNSWKQLLKEEGIEVSQKRILDEELLEEIKETAQKLGRVPRSFEMKRLGSIRYHFGSWNRALALAGLEKREKNQRPKRKNESCEILTV